MDFYQLTSLEWFSVFTVKRQSEGETAASVLDNSRFPVVVVVCSYPCVDETWVRPGARFSPLVAPTPASVAPWWPLGVRRWQDYCWRLKAEPGLKAAPVLV